MEYSPWAYYISSFIYTYISCYFAPILEKKKHRRVVEVPLPAGHGVFFFQTQIIVISHPVCHNGTARCGREKDVSFQSSKPHGVSSRNVRYRAQ